MKCLLVTVVFPPIRGGAATVYRNLHRHGGPSISVLTQRYDFETGQLIPDSSRAWERLHLVNRLVAPTTPSRNLVHSLWNFATTDLPVRLRVVAAVLRLLSREKFDVVCVGEVGWLGWLSPVLQKMTRTKVLIFVHGEELTMASDGRFLGRQHRRLLQSATGVVCVSNFTRSVLIEQYQIAPERIRTITNGVDLEAYPRQAQPDGTPRSRDDETIRLLSLGRLVERKGFDRLLDAMALVRVRFPGIHLTIAGDGPLRQHLEHQRRQLGLEEFVTIAGSVSHEKAVDLYRSCDVFIMPNRTMPDGDTEGFGLVFLEANAFGKPVIGGRAGGVVDAVQDEITGLLVDGTDVEAIATAVLRLAGDPSLRQVMGQQAYEWALQNDVRIKVREFVNYCREVSEPAH